MDKDTKRHITQIQLDNICQVLNAKLTHSISVNSHGDSHHLITIRYDEDFRPDAQ